MSSLTGKSRPACDMTEMSINRSTLFMFTFSTSSPLMEIFHPILISKSPFGESQSSCPTCHPKSSTKCSYASPFTTRADHHLPRNRKRVTITMPSLSSNLKIPKRSQSGDLRWAAPSLWSLCHSSVVSMSPMTVWSSPTIPPKTRPSSTWTTSLADPTSSMSPKASFAK